MKKIFAICLLLMAPLANSMDTTRVGDFIGLCEGDSQSYKNACYFYSKGVVGSFGHALMVMGSGLQCSGPYRYSVYDLYPDMAKELKEGRISRDSSAGLAANTIMLRKFGCIE